MKQLLLIGALALVAALSAHGQGSVTIANTTPTRVYMTTPTGTTPIPVGNRFTAECVFAPDGTALDAFNSIALRVGATTTFGPVPGIFNFGGRTVTSIQPAGGFGLFQIRVWETAAGSDYRAAVATGDPQWQAGTSLIMRIDTADPTTVPPGTPTPITSSGFASFTVTPIPEPSVIALGLIGAGALLTLRRRK